MVVHTSVHMVVVVLLVEPQAALLVELLVALLVELLVVLLVALLLVLLVVVVVPPFGRTQTSLELKIQSRAKAVVLLKFLVDAKL